MKVSNGKFYGNPSSVKCTCAFGRADMKKGIAFFVTMWTQLKCMNFVLYFEGQSSEHLPIIPSVNNYSCTGMKEFYTQSISLRI